MYRTEAVDGVDRKKEEILALAITMYDLLCIETRDSQPSWIKFRFTTFTPALKIVEHSYLYFVLLIL